MRSSPTPTVGSVLFAVRAQAPTCSSRRESRAASAADASLGIRQTRVARGPSACGGTRAPPYPRIAGAVEVVEMPPGQPVRLPCRRSACALRASVCGATRVCVFGRPRSSRRARRRPGQSAGSTLPGGPLAQGWRDGGVSGRSSIAGTGSWWPRPRRRFCARGPRRPASPARALLAAVGSTRGRSRCA